MGYSFRRYATKNIHILSIIVLLMGQVFLPYINTAPVQADSSSKVDKLEQYADDADWDEWHDGNLNDKKSSYAEGESVPFRATLSDLSTEEDNDEHTLVIEYDNVEQNKHAYDYLTSYDRDRNPDPCDGEACTGVESTETIPTDSTLSSVAQAPGDISIWNGQITDVSYESKPGHDTGSNKSTSIQVTFTAEQSDVVLAWGGHIAKESDWGIGEGASSISGSPYHMRLTELDGGSPGSQDRSMKADAVILLPRIDISKSVDGGDADPNDFSFNVTADDSDFDDQSPYKITEGSTVTIFDIPDGSYTIVENTEDNPEGYEFGSGSGDEYCSFNNETETATAVVASGTSGDVQHASCEFTNTVQPGSITIEKETVPSGNSQNFEFETSIDGESNFSLGDGQEETFSLDAGEYKFTELDTDGWELTNLVCMDGDEPTVGTIDVDAATATIDLSAGEDVTCTYTNTEQVDIVIEKLVDPDDSQHTYSFTSTSENWDISESISHNETINRSELSPDTYSVLEEDNGFSNLQDITCEADGNNVKFGSNDYDVNGREVDIHAQAGHGTITCTFSNIELGSITIEKEIETISETEIDPNFTFTGSEESLDGEITGDGSYESDLLKPGSYEITEEELDGWTLTDLECRDENDGQSEEDRTATVDLGPGEHVTCIFTNTRDTGTIVIEKVLDPADDNGRFDLLVGDNVIKENAGHNDSGSTQVVTGSYEVSEAAGDNTDLEDYSSSLACDDDSETSGDSTFANIEVTRHGQTVTCTFANTRLAELTIEKTTVPEESEQKFDFDIIGPNGYDQKITLDTAADTDTDNAETLDGLTPGEYTAEELETDGWKLTDLSCSDVSEQSTNKRTASIDIDAGDSITCTFTNTQTFDLTIEKMTNPATADQGFTFDVEGINTDEFTLNTDGTSTKTFEDLEPGDYTVLEELEAGWHFDDAASTCDVEGESIVSRNEGSTGIEFSVTAGSGDITCTFVNTQLTDVEIQKVVNPDDSEHEYGFNSTSDNWEIDEEIGRTETIERTGLLPGTYSVAEDKDSGSVLESIVCDSSGEETTFSPEGREANIEVEAGDGVITCTFSNVEHARIVAKKITEPAESEGDFEVELTGGNVFGGGERTKVISAGDDGSVEFIVDGDGGVDYSLKEVDLPNGWDLTDLECVDDDEGATVGTVDEDIATIKIHPGDDVTCTFTNTQRGSITIEKEIETISETESDPTFTFTSDVQSLDDQITGESSYESDLLKPGNYEVTEEELAGWTLTDLECGDENDGQSVEDRTATVDLDPGEHVTCTFTNTRDTGTVIVEKLLEDDPEVTQNFEFTSSGGGAEGTIEFEDGVAVDDNTIEKEVTTGTYTTQEFVPDGWELTGISCEVEPPGNGVTPSETEPPEESSGTGDVAEATATFNVANNGDTVTCAFTNALHDLALNIEKEVSTPTAEIGNFVTYTLRIENDSEGISHNTTVTDVPPEGFVFQEGSWTARSTRADHDVVADIGPEDGPTYASPGNWNLGEMTPGEVVTLSYKARVTGEVEPGDYPDLAYVRGQQQGGSTVFGNIHRQATANDPFVGTLVSIDEDEEVSAEFAAEPETTVQTLPKTGTSLVWLPAIIAFAGVFMFENWRGRRTRQFMQQGVIS